jgi:hypothetical protein
MARDLWTRYGAAHAEPLDLLNQLAENGEDLP